MITELAKQEDAEELANLRAIAMKESLKAIGRYDPIRVRERFLSTFEPNKTIKFTSHGKLAGFYVVIENSDHMYLDHLYVHPTFQGHKLGSTALKIIIEQAKKKDKPIRLGALKGSKSNFFYSNHGFIKTRETEYDNYYEYNHS